jgi:hypothetical protein
MRAAGHADPGAYRTRREADDGAGRQSGCESSRQSGRLARCGGGLARCEAGGQPGRGRLA